MTPMTREWLRKADADLRSDQRLIAARPADHDVVCYHCQQAVEKYFKGFLQELGAAFPKTHNLKMLVDLVIPFDPTVKTLGPRVRPLTKYGVEYRYPGFRANRSKSRRALVVAEQVRAEVRRRLGLRP
jgi:HEPN domain-containing protein